MKFKSTILSLLALGSFATVALAGPKTYQVTGPVLAVTDTSITVQKGDEKWEITRDGKTPVTGKIAVGSKVTVTYTMDATGIEVKGGADKAPVADQKGAATKKGKK